jgi:cold shock CspA family protein
MAKSRETYSKKQRETNRLKQLQDKKHKAEERRANKKDGNKLEDMMAYLDENGNLSDTPPDPRKKKEFKQEDMQIGVPKYEHVEELPRTGTITFFNTAKGFGFINDLQTNERVFFHVNEIQEQLQESDKVQFFVEQGPRGLNAIQVLKMN